MGRGLGKWQKYVLEQVEALELNQVLPVQYLFTGDETHSEKEAVRRAVRSLAKAGHIQTAEGWATMKHNGRLVERLGVLMARKEAEPIPQRRMSYREIASALGVSHTTVAKVSRELD